MRRIGMSTAQLLLTGTVLCAGWSSPAVADAGPFAAGRSRLSISGGSSGGFGTERYLVLGATYGYFVADGLELGLGAQAWLLGDPTQYTLTPQARYVLHMVPTIKPYVGAFYSRWFVSGGREDVSTVGARAGAFYVTGRGGFVGGGIVYEKLLDCPGTDDECSDIYPEIAFSLAF